MNERQFHFQDLPVELFRHIFEYIAPHDLLNAFERLNRRFDIMLAQQPLWLPNNRQMSIQLYCHYLKKIVTKHPSQIVYLYLSERTQLQNLHVTFLMSDANIENELLLPIPLKQTFAPELRHINLKIFGDVPWILTFFADLQRYRQLDQMNISDYERFADYSHFPRVAVLRHWLTLSKSKIFTFKLNLDIIYAFSNREIREEIFAEYRLATGTESAARYGKINLSYPTMVFSYPLETDDHEWEDLDSSDSTQGFECVEEMDIYELDYVKDERLVQLEAIPCWHHLRKINLEGDCPDDKGVVGENISHLLHIAQRSSYFSELYIESDLDYGRVLSLNKQFGRLLSRQLVILHYTAQEANSSLGDLVRIIDKLFSYGQSSPRLKQLILNIDAHPDSWLSTRHLVLSFEKIFKRFPSLTHLTLNCKATEACRNSVQNLSTLASEWYVVSLLSRKMPMSSVEYRHKPHLIEIWL
ncbi:unnamed protein product [Rotaria socialis]|uniref:F-box domain-containing protein n=1 Tax=Rotaria socialis TaxID=392032 RepID=A0A817RFQ2_9BILA|nr:unnamed protein product [Rotaria socialis]